MPTAKPKPCTNCFVGRDLTSQTTIEAVRRQIDFKSRKVKRKKSKKTKLSKSQKSKAQSVRDAASMGVSGKTGLSVAQKEDTESQILRKKALMARRAERIKMMFLSSFDPYEKPLGWWEQRHVKYAFSYSPVKSKLEALMGSSVVRLTDRKFMLKLVSKIRQDHEAKQDARIQDRKMRELVRTKTLILNRFIPVQEAPAEIYEYPLFQLYAYCDAMIERCRQKHTTRKVRMSKALYRLLYPTISDDELEEEEEGQEEEDNVPMKEVMIDGVLQMVPLTKEEFMVLETTQDIENGYMFTQDEYNNLHYEADAVKKLKEAKTVNDMYTKAQEIVGNLFNLTAADKRKRCTQDVKTVEEASDEGD